MNKPGSLGKDKNTSDHVDEVQSSAAFDEERDQKNWKLFSSTFEERRLTGSGSVANDDDQDVNEFVDFGAAMHVILKEEAFDEEG